MIELFLTIFSTAFFVTVIRTTTPLLLATLGGLVADLSGALLDQPAVQGHPRGRP